GGLEGQRRGVVVLGELYLLRRRLDRSVELAPFDPVLHGERYVRLDVDLAGGEVQLHGGGLDARTEAAAHYALEVELGDPQARLDLGEVGLHLGQVAPRLEELRLRVRPLGEAVFGDLELPAGEVDGLAGHLPQVPGSQDAVVGLFHL